MPSLSEHDVFKTFIAKDRAQHKAATLSEMRQEIVTLCKLRELSKVQESALKSIWLKYTNLKKNMKKGGYPWILSQATEKVVQSSPVNSTSQGDGKLCRVSGGRVNGG